MEIKGGVVMLPTKKAGDDFIIFKHTHDWRGELIFNPKLEYSDNPTYIRNTKLINSGRAATNAIDKYDFFELCFTSDEEIKQGEYFYDSFHKEIFIANKTVSNVANKYHKKIIATTNKSLIDCKFCDNVNNKIHKHPAPIPKSFIEIYIHTLPIIKEVPIVLKDNTVIVNSYTA